MTEAADLWSVSFPQMESNVTFNSGAGQTREIRVETKRPGRG